MAVISDLLGDRTDLDDAGVEHLQALLAEWQILADLSFADLLLFVRDDLPDGRPGFLCVGQMRPYTAQTIYLDDLVGVMFPVLDRPMVARAFADGRVIRDADPDWSTGVPVREEAIPVRYQGGVIAVITREANVATARSPSNLELTYLQAAGQLARMVADGTFPYRRDERPEDRELSPRVGDGIMKLDRDRIVTYASPNAISAYRRLGYLEPLMGAAMDVFDPEPQEVLLAFVDGVPVIGEIERERAAVLRRLLPLIADGQVAGSLVLVREVTELRRHERALLVKDATIREIHHRVKNNLQTVASLLRLQTRRLQSREAREALEESVRRIGSIALVHETLSREAGQRANFLQITTRIVDMLGHGLTDPESPIAFEVDGDPGELAADVATPLALVLSELVQNCVEHAFDGRPGAVRIAFERGLATLQVTVSDDGRGLPEGAADLDGIANLGLQIARTLVSSELGGTFEALPVPVGTAIRLVIPLP